MCPALPSIMSFAVVRGAASAAQLHLDGLLDEVRAGGGSRAAGRGGVALSQLMYHCLKRNPHDLFMVRGPTSQ